MDFPCFMYHAEHGARVFDAPEALQEAGSGWVDTPAKLPNEQKSAEVVEKRKPGRPKKAE
jgi:hypothetical protein